MAGENRLENYLRVKCVVEGIFVRKVVAVGSTGFPDRFLAYDGRVYLVELKNPNGRGNLSAKQIATSKALSEVGIIPFVIDSFDGVDRLITAILSDAC